MQSADDGCDVCGEGEHAGEAKGGDVAAFLRFFGETQEEEVQDLWGLLEVVFVGAVCSDGGAFVVAEMVPRSAVDQRRVPWPASIVHVRGRWWLGLEQLDIVHLHLERPRVVAEHLCAQKAGHGGRWSGNDHAARL